MGKGRERRRIKQGIYEMVHFSMDIDLWGSNNFEQSRPEIPGVESEYGVCDSPEQFEELLGPLIQKDPRYFVVSLTHIIKKYEPAEGGWRWRKWGPYIGKGNPQEEYLYDEKGFEGGVWVYHIYELKPREFIEEKGVGLMGPKVTTLKEYMAALKAQNTGGVKDAVVVCVVCGTPQSCEDLIAAGAGKDFDEVEPSWGFSCIGRFLGSGPYRKGCKKKNPAQIGCDWTLGGLFRIHTLEVIGPDGKHHSRFEPATPEVAQAHFKGKEERLASLRKLVEELNAPVKPKGRANEDKEDKR